MRAPCHEEAPWDARSAHVEEEPWRLRFAEQMPLTAVALQPTEDLGLLVGLDELGDDRLPEPMGGVDHGSDDDLVLVSGRQVAHERTVDLQDVEGELPEVVERR